MEKTVALQIAVDAIAYAYPRTSADPASKSYEARELLASMKAELDAGGTIYAEGSE